MKGILYLQSSYSMLKNMIPLESLFLVCQKEGYEFIALTDEQLHGTYDLFKNAKKYNLRPILGMVVDIFEPNETKFL
ncbi:MAG TPA: PHP domain-containing protein, partial [Haploplasma sp.]|nr:PHP domain-containing protein [Haploplasma sp.]